MRIDEQWLEAAVNTVVQDQIVGPGQDLVPDPILRVEALFRGWAVSFAAERRDVETSEFSAGSRGWHPDECAALLRGLDTRRLHIDSAGYAWPLCAAPKPGQTRYSLCCKSGDGVTVNLEYLIQLGTIAELSQVLGWPSDRLRVELGEFDGAALDSSDRSVLLMEAKCRAIDSRASADTLEKLLRSWLHYANGDPPTRGSNAANKYLYLLDRVSDGPVTVLLVAAGARWWLNASRQGNGICFEEASPLSWKSDTTG